MTELKKHRLTIRKTFDYHIEVDGETLREAKEKAESIKFDFKKAFEKKEIKSERQIRTEKQSDSLHLWLTWYSKALTEKGVTVKNLIEKINERGYEIFPSMIFLKEDIWKRIQKKAFGYESTKDLDRHKEFSQIQMYFTNLMAQVGDIEPIAFPDQSIKYYEKTNS